MYTINLNQSDQSLTLTQTVSSITLTQTVNEISLNQVGIRGLPGVAGQPGPKGDKGDQGDPGTPGIVQSIVAGSNVTVDETDPANPIVSATGGGGGGDVSSVNGQTGIVVLDTDDIADTATNRFTDDTAINRLANTSGTNTGDQDLSGLVPKTTTVNGHALSSNVTVTKGDVGLGNADNTSDANKPISTATQTALNAKLSNITGLIDDGTNVTITGTGTSGDPYVINASGGSGGITSVVAGNNIDVDNTDPDNPIVSVESLTVSDITDITATATEINYTDGVTSSIQTQLNGKEPTKGTDDNYVTDSQLVVIGNTSGTNTGDNATNTQYSGLAASKQDTITGLTASGAELNILDGATLTTTELNYVDGVTSGIQSQLNAKLSNITGLIDDGANVTITGSGTSGDPYVINASGGGGGSAEWGDITGTLSDQTDLQGELDDKVPYTGATDNLDMTGFNITGSLGTFDEVHARAGDVAMQMTPNTLQFFNDTGTVHLYGSDENILELQQGQDTTNSVRLDLGDLTDVRTQEFQDADGTIALTSDITVTSVNGDTGTVVLNQDDVLDGTTYKQYSQTEKTKLAGIDTAADVTDATNVGAAGAFMKSVDDTDDITVGSTNKFATAAEKTKVGFISVTQAVDLDAIETNANNVPGIKTKTDFISVTQAVDLDAIETNANNVPGIKTKTDFITVTQAVDLDTMESDIAGKQPLDSDLTTIAGLTATTDNVIQSVGSAWASRTPAQLKATLALAKGDVGLGNVDNLQQQPIDSDLTAIAGLTPTNDDIIQRKAGAWTNRTVAQFVTDMGLGSVYQPLDSDLTSWAGVTRASGYDTFAATPSGANLASLLTSALPASKGGTGLTALASNIVSILSAADYAAVRTLLSLVIGTNVQAWDADLDTWATKTAPSGTVLGTTDTQTMTNKRRTRRLTTTNAPGATPTTNTDNVDVMNFTGLATAITSMTTNLSGSPVDGDQIEFRFTDNATPRAITWGASFAATTVALPTTTVASTILRVGFEHNGSLWQCVAVA